MLPDKADVGKWADFIRYAPQAASARDITPAAFAKGLNLTLGAAKLLNTDREKIPPEFLLDLFDAINSGKWDAATGTFKAQ
jgi:hypothetical protein